MKEEGKSSLEVQEKHLNVLKAQHEKINSRLSRLYDAKFDNEITEEVFISKEKGYQSQLLEIKSNMEGLQRNNPRFYEDDAGQNSLKDIFEFDIQRIARGQKQFHSRISPQSSTLINKCIDDAIAGIEEKRSTP